MAGSKYAELMSKCDDKKSEDGDQLVGGLVETIKAMSNMAMACDVHKATKEAQHMSCKQLKDGFCGCY